MTLNDGSTEKLEREPLWLVTLRSVKGGGMQEEMVLMCSDDTEAGTMVELEVKNGEMNTEIQKEERMDGSGDVL